MTDPLTLAESLGADLRAGSEEARRRANVPAVLAGAVLVGVALAIGSAVLGVCAAVGVRVFLALT